MFKFISRLSVFVVIAFLVLAPGWCAGSCFYRQHAAEVVQAKSAIGGCCQHKHSPSQKSQTPTTAEMHCCCTRVAVVAEKFVPQNSDGQGIVFAADVSDVFAELGSPTYRLVDPLQFRSCPPLRILLCVWRC